MRTIKKILAIMMIAALCAGGVVLAEEPTAKIITPNNPEIDIEALADGEYPAAFEPAALADGELTFTVYWEDTFDVVEISQLAPGDTLYVGDTVVDVETVEQDDGDLLINGGLDNGGVTLRPYDEDNCWRAVLEDDLHTYFKWGETTLPLSEDVTFTDGWDIEKDPVIQEVLRELGLTTDRVAHDAAYPIVNSASPKLCADRLEYSLGNMVNYGFAGTEEARGYLRNAAAGTNEAGEEEILFRDRAAAAAFAKRALQCGKVYSSENDRYGMEILAELLKKALQEGILAEEDLYTTEKEVIGKLLASPLSGEWEQFTEMKELEIRRDPPKEGERGWRCLHVKKRWINPLTAGGDRVYDCDPAFHRALDVFLEDDQNTYLRDVRWRERSSNE